MAEKYTLSVTKRTPGKQEKRELQSQNRVCGVVYGYGIESLPVSMDASEILRTYRKAGSAGLINLTLDGKEHQVIIKDMDLHPVRNEISHVDFFVLDPKQKTTVKVPLKFEGTSPAVKNFGGIFTVAHEYIEIRCLPADIPHDFVMDISGLDEMGSHLTVADLNLDEKKYEVAHLAPTITLCTIAGRKAKEVETESTEEEGEGEAAE